MNESTAPVLIIGAGVNGVAIARELLLNQVPVTIVDRADIASGASAYNSRLIHGGLRYLEYGEFELVKESLAERERLLQHAAHLVHPLQLYIPCQNRWSGTRAATRRFFGKPADGTKTSRGWWLVRIGLGLYDHFSKQSQLPDSSSCSVGQAEAPPVDAHRYRWFCTYYDAQVRYPERLVLAQLADAHQLAAEANLPFQLLTYHQVQRQPEGFQITPLDAALDHANSPSEPIHLQPAAIINATGASVDAALEQIEVESKRLIGGTKGSHLLTRNRTLLQALGSAAIYAEASDHRPIFLLPFGQSVLIGTTDIPFEGDPAEAVASEREIEYLIEAVNEIFPQVKLTPDQVDQHYCGVRPLPYVAASSTGSVTRRHWLYRHPEVSPPLFSVIGGKLTTCRQLAEDVVAQVLPAIDLPINATSRERPLPGNPAGGETCEQWATRRGLTPAQADRVWQLCGTQADQLTLNDPRNTGDSSQPFPPGFVRGVIRQEQPRHLADLVERRLAMVYDPQLSREHLAWLAELLVEEGIVPAEQAEKEIETCIDRLREAFGKQVIA